LRSYLHEGLVRVRGAMLERVVVFDEAQRAWDRERVLLKHRGQLVGSEPDLLLRIADRAPDEPFVLVALVGDGQEIRAREESGISQWIEAVRTSSRWSVVAPPHLAESFRDSGVPVREEPLLNLTLSLRSHRALQVSAWANLVIGGQLHEAASVAASVRREGFV